jgi:hypothetical protein
MIYLIIAGNDYKDYDFSSIERAKDVSTAQLALLGSDYDDYDYTEILTFEGDGRYIVGGCYAADYYRGDQCDINSIRNFDDREEAFEYGRSLKGYDYFSIKMV